MAPPETSNRNARKENIMTPSTDRKKLIDKVIKLLTLAESTTFDEEAENAKRMASELMAKHNIEISEALQRESAAFNQKDKTLNHKDPYGFDITLMNCICIFNGVLMITGYNYKLHKAKASYIGAEEDIEAAEYMIDIVYAQRKRAYKAYRLGMIGKLGKEYFSEFESSYWNSWHNGFTQGVQAKIHELRKMTEQKTREWGLVPVEPHKLALAWYNKNMEGTRSFKAGHRNYSEDGLNAGRNVSLNRGVTHTPTLKIEGGN